MIFSVFSVDADYHRLFCVTKCFHCKVFVGEVVEEGTAFTKLQNINLHVTEELGNMKFT